MDSQIDAQSKTDDDKSKREGKRKEWDLSPIGIMVRGVRPPSVLWTSTTRSARVHVPQIPKCGIYPQGASQGETRRWAFLCNWENIHPSSFIIHTSSLIFWRQHFPRVHQIFGVDRLLDGAHQGKRPSPMLRVHIFLLPHPNAMLARDRPTHG